MISSIKLFEKLLVNFYSEIIAGGSNAISQTFDSDNVIMYIYVLCRYFNLRNKGLYRYQLCEIPYKNFDLKIRFYIKYSNFTIFYISNNL